MFVKSLAIIAHYVLFRLLYYRAVIHVLSLLHYPFCYSHVSWFLGVVLSKMSLFQCLMQLTFSTTSLKRMNGHFKLSNYTGKQSKKNGKDQPPTNLLYRMLSKYSAYLILISNTCAFSQLTAISAR